MASLHGNSTNGSSMNGPSMNGNSMNGNSMNGNSANGGNSNGVGADHLTWADPQNTELEREQDRLRHELAEAKARLDAAKDRIAHRDADLHEALRSELAVAQQMMADREEQHRRTLADVRESARQEAERIVQAARAGDASSGADAASDWVQHGQ
jgi:hypothetical protein